MSREIRVCGFLLLAVVSLSLTAIGGDAAGPRPAPGQAEQGDLVRVIIVMKDRPDVAQLDAAASGKSRQLGRRAVCSLLKRHAAESQADIRAYLESMASQGRAEGMKHLWINNTIAGWVDRSVVAEIAKRSDIRSIRENVPREAFMAPVQPAPAPAPSPAAGGGRANAWGIEWIGAAQAWCTYGVDGSGVVVAMIDTGMDYYHSDLSNNTWVNPGEDMDNDGVVWDTDDLNGVDDDGNGYIDDLVGYDFGLGDNNPMDDYGHGTHCSGTVGGDGSGGTQTGVAPGVKLMTCKCGYWVTYTDEATCWEGMEYAADNGADVLSMSMGWWQEWLPHRVTWRETCQYVKAAGTTQVICAGNERHYTWIVEPDNIRTPGDCPEVVCAGALGYKNNTYAYFSSYGPTEWYEAPFFDYPYPPGLTKPDMTAPGENVNSTTWNGGYSGDTWSGTSMSTPHIAGVCALMLEANPSLTPDDVQQILEDTAIDLGAAGKDNDYGSGMVWAPDAVQGALNHGGVSVTLTPVTTVVPRGGDLDFWVDILNTGSAPVTTDAWIDVDLYGSPYSGNPVRGPLVITIPASGTINSLQHVHIPMAAPVGNIYDLYLRLGTHPSSVIAEDSFSFEVTP